MQALKEFIKRYILPESLLRFTRPYYHGMMAVLASFYYGQPSSKMIVIGVTGTAGKSTTVQMLSRILNQVGRKCGFITTVSFFDGEKEFINKHGLSMPGGWLLQKQLKQMLDHGCQYAIVECTSEGLAQNRHLGVNFDTAIFTNLSKAHLEAHNGFENYKKAKGKLFKAISNKQKVGSRENIAKTIIVNLDDEDVEYFLNFQAQKKVAVSFAEKESGQANQVFQAKEVSGGFEMQGQKFEVKLFGKFNNQNAGLAVAVANSLGVSLEDCARALSIFDKIKGRMESVKNNRGISVFVDYGCEPASIKAVLMAASAMPHKRLIHVFGSTGGHRDVGKRFEFGKISAELADYIIITNDDVYESDPENIAKDIELGIRNQESGSTPPASPPKIGGELKEGYEIVLDRRAAIRRALEIAQAGDLVLITGKGSEQFLVLPGSKRIEWDEVSVVKEELEKISNN